MDQKLVRDIILNLIATLVREPAFDASKALEYEDRLDVEVPLTLDAIESVGAEFLEEDALLVWAREVCERLGLPLPPFSGKNLDAAVSGLIERHFTARAYVALMDEIARKHTFVLSFIVENGNALRIEAGYNEKRGEIHDFLLTAEGFRDMFVEPKETGTERPKARVLSFVKRRKS